MSMGHEWSFQIKKKERNVSGGSARKSTVTNKLQNREAGQKIRYVIFRFPLFSHLYLSLSHFFLFGK
jgi:hypothetical protein